MIGVAAVISIVSIGRGAENTITGSIQGIGTNLLFVFRGGSEDVRNPQPITLGDAAAIADHFQAPSVAGVAPMLMGEVEISAGGESTTTTVDGVTPEYSSVRNVQVTEGEFISEEHILGRASVVLLGPDVAERLFERTEGLVGETVRIEGQPFRVLGVLESKGGSGFGNQDDRIIVPYTTAQTRLLRRSTRDGWICLSSRRPAPMQSLRASMKSPRSCAPATATPSVQTILPSSPSRISWIPPIRSPMC